MKTIDSKYNSFPYLYLSGRRGGSLSFFMMASGIGSVLFVVLAFPSLFSQNSLFTKGYRAGEDIPIYGCVLRKDRDVVVKKGDGEYPPYYIYPRKGEDFFHVVRRFSRPVRSEDMQPLLEESEGNLESNAILRRSSFEEKGNLWVYSFARKENPELLEFFLSCEE